MVDASADDGLFLGATSALNQSAPEVHRLPAHHMTTHTVIVGMTGSGKSGLVTVLIEEAARSSVPVVVIDVKGDLTNLLLTPDFAPSSIVPWVEPGPRDKGPNAREELAAKLAEERRVGLTAWGIREAELAAYRAGTHVRVLTPGTEAGETLHVLSSLERRSSRWDTDADGARSALSAGVSLVMRLLGRDPDPARSREHVLLSLLAERRLKSGQTADIGALLPEIAEPPLTSIGALDVDDFISKRARKDLAAALNALLASPSFASWRQGATLDVGEWMSPVITSPERPAKTPITIVSVAHLDDDERELVLGVVLEEILTWVRGLPGSQQLRALIVFDEVYGFLPPHPASPPTKRPLVALMKQARAFGVGVVIATQNPMDLDYRSLSNAGLWCLGRLQTDADRARVLDGLVGNAGEEAAQMSGLLKRLAPRWFLMRDVRSKKGTVFLQPRWAMSFMRGPMTRAEIKRARESQP
ncbi:MAG: ATP-binding protein [Polyangiaceae bacterium]|nr:ATP-binding protein [Polyangiaceae bacterium]